MIRKVTSVYSRLEKTAGLTFATEVLERDSEIVKNNFPSVYNLFSLVTERICQLENQMIEFEKKKTK
jgi:hypothetical protein